MKSNNKTMMIVISYEIIKNKFKINDFFKVITKIDNIFQLKEFIF